MRRIVIVGAGVVGASVARVLSEYEGLEIHLVEKEADVGWGASKANTGILHAGYDDEPEKYPLRAELCVEGNRLWRRWSEELGIPVKWTGSLVAAFSDEEVRTLEELLRRGMANGVPGLRIVEGEELRRLEPNLSPNAVAALWAPTAGVISPWDAVIALVENAVANGVKLHVLTRVTSVKVKEGRVLGVETDKGFIRADWVINAAGVYADNIARMAGAGGFMIRPRRGEYLVFDKDAWPKARRVLFPTPRPGTKGVVVVTTVHGNLMIGPNAEDLPRNFKDCVETTSRGLEYVWKEASRLVCQLPPRNRVIRVYAGLRPEPEGGDFIIGESEEVKGFINLAGIRSPGFTAAPAIALRAAEIIMKAEGSLPKKRRLAVRRVRAGRLAELSWAEKAKLARKKPGYGVIVCKHELVSMAEVEEALDRIMEIGAFPTIDGVKYRTRATMGVCQGGFCRLKIAAAIARRLGIPVWKVTVKGPGSEIGVGDVKALLREAEG